MSVIKVLIYLSWLLFLPLLIIGNIFPEDRLTLSFAPLNFIIFFFLFIIFCLLFFNFKNNNDIKRISLLVAPFFVLFMTCFSFYDVSLIGIQKYFNYLILGYVGGALLIMSSDVGELKGIFKVIAYFLMALFIAALLWKLKFGFWERHVHYFLNGPIVFGRNMAVGFFLSLFLARYERKFLVFCFIFAFGVFWSMSKGPILAFIISCSFIIYMKNKVNFIIFFVVLGILGFTILSGIIDLSDTPFKRVQLGLQVSLGFSDSSSASGSVGIRKEMIISSVELISNHYFMGVGAGNWGIESYLPFSYPHNLFLEAYSELGIFMATICLIPCCVFLFFYRSPFFVLPLFFLISHQFSGDAADARWLLLFALFVYAEGNKSKLYTKNTDSLLICRC